jgi:diguanylate cyclase (GGDEF)-like protein/PAS domain S-box-containing protein
MLLAGVHGRQHENLVVCIDRRCRESYLVDADSGQLLYLSAFACALSGWEYGELQYASSSRLCPALSQENLRAIFHHVDTPGFHTLRTRFLRKDGSDYEREVLLQYLQKPDSSLWTIILNELRQQSVFPHRFGGQLQWREAGEMNMANENGHMGDFPVELQKISGLGEWEMNLNRQSFSCNDGVYDLLGEQREKKVLGMESYLMRVHDLDRERVRSAYEAVFSGNKKSLEISYRVEHENGNIFFVKENGIVIEDQDGTTYKALLKDITQSREAEFELSLYRHALQTTSDGVIICDARLPHNPIISANHAFKKLTGYDADDVLGLSCNFLVGHDTQQFGLNEIKIALTQHHEASAVLKSYRKDGSWFWNHLKISPVHNDDGVVTHFLASLSDVTSRINYEKELATQANRDSLTGLPNRNLLEDRIERVLGKARREGGMVGIAFIDVDHFKSINDTLGHQTGDQFLKIVSERLVSSLRDGDTVSRFGGDEFVVVCHDITTVVQMNEIVGRIFKRLREPLHIDAHQIDVDASIGIAMFPLDGESVIDLLKCADMAMHKAKELGRGNSQFYEKEMGIRVSERTRTERDLRNALEKNQFFLHFQPKVSSQTGDICGMEALVRWKHPERGNIPPAEFIPLAEESKLIINLGEWVMLEACKQNQLWRNAGLSNFPISVNASTVQFRDHHFPQIVERVLTKTGLPPTMLELEITESLATESPESFIVALKRLKQIGIRIAIDDFGTGYSSLSYLKRFPIDVLKIDRSFVRDITTDADDAAICRTIINLAHNLKMSVVAEGVESEAQASYLKRHQCDELQGYLVCRPDLPNIITARLADRQSMLNLPRLGVTSPNTLLIVDDEENILRILSRLLKPEGYRILTANSANKALAMLAENEVDVIVADQRMPEMSGTEFLHLAKDIYPESVRMVLSGHADFDSITGAINRGAIYKFMVKPWDDDMLTATIREAFRHRDLIKENRQLRQHMGGATLH